MALVFPDKDVSAIYYAVGRALNAWTEVEKELEPLFSVLSGADDLAGQITMASILSFKARIQVCNNLIPGLFPTPDLKARWTNLFNRMARKMDRRNELAHFSVVAMNLVDEGKIRASLVPYYSPGGASIQFQRNADNYFGPYLEGLTAKQIREREVVFRKLASDLAAFVRDAQAHKTQLRAALAQLRDQHQAPENPSDQTPTDK